MTSKSTYRKVILQYRRLLDEQVYLDLNKKLCAAVLAFIERKNIENIHTFLAIAENKEPDISSLFDHLRRERRNIYVSKTDFKSKQMIHYQLVAQTKVVLNKMGIPEPVDAREVSIEEVDTIFVPLLLSDRRGYRIGYGGGYYDRLLNGTNSLKVGLSLSSPVDEILQTEEWDIPLDYLITPYKTYNYGSNYAWRN